MWNRILLIGALFILAFQASDAMAQSRGKRPFSKSELTYLTHKVDSIKRNLNRMIRYERELMQRNYYLNEKTALVDELIATLKYLNTSVEVVAYGKAEVRRIFGKPAATPAGRLIYEIETYKSNCPFMEIAFYLKDNSVGKVEYQITDCQKWK